VYGSSSQALRELSAPSTIRLIYRTNEAPPATGFIDALLDPSEIGRDESSFPTEGEEIETIRNEDRHLRELLSPPMIDAEIALCRVLRYCVKASNSEGQPCRTHTSSTASTAAR
jgi:hypothetical protein